MAPEARTQETRRKSTISKLAGKFRRGSAISQELEQLETCSNGRKGSVVSTDQRRSSVASSSSAGPKLRLSLRLKKSRGEEPKEDIEDNQPPVP